MKELELKYGCNPNQKPAKLFMNQGKDLPFKVLNRKPGYINFLDALNGWQLVSELSAATGLPAATSFKHVSPTSAALGLPLSKELKKAVFVEDIEGLDQSPLAMAYARARGTDRLSSFGDFIALSHPCDFTTAKIIQREVSDGIIAPGYSPEALEILREKRKGSYSIIEIDPSYVPEDQELKQVFGVVFQQGRNNSKIDKELLSHVVTTIKGEATLPSQAQRDLLVALITLKYTQSNSVCFAKDGQAIGVGAGQQSRIHCTRLAGSKADLWHLRQHEKTLNLPFNPSVGRAERDNLIDIYLSLDAQLVLEENSWEEAERILGWQDMFTAQPEKFPYKEQKEYLAGLSGVSLGSDAFFPFPDNIVRAYESGVSYIAQPGGSVRDDLVIKACQDRGMAMCFTGLRLFHH